MKIKYILSPLFILMTPSLVLAHTKWFASGPIDSYITSEPSIVYFSVLAVVVAIIVGIGIYINRFEMSQLSFLKPKVPHSFERAAAVFSMVAGAFFLISATQQYLFSPNLGIESGVPLIFIIIQALIGLALLIGVYDRIAAGALVLLWVSSWFIVSPISVLENIWVLGVALFIMIMGNDYFRLVKVATCGAFMRKYESYAMPILRVGTGITLLVLGFSEKILRPEYGINFLNQHSWNFMQQFGIPFSDYLFVLSAGSVEALFGLIFILGVVTRINALIVAIFFTIPLFILGPIELAGHMPHFAAVVLILFFGAGTHFRFSRG